MSVKKELCYKNVFYYCTITCYNWISLIEITELYDYIYKWFDILKQKNVKISGYVIMPNHMHLLIYVHEQAPTINRLIGTGKRFMAYEIVKRLKKNNKTKILQLLSASVKASERQKNKLHNVFEPSFDVKPVVSEKFLVQKLNYIHANPIRDKWNLADDFRKYPHSSAGFYEDENFNGYLITHYKDI